MSDTRSRWAMLVVAGAVLVAAGCTGRHRELDTTYGKTGGSPGLRSINGTAVLAGMFERAGNRVTTTTRFSPRLESADVIVWAPNDFAPPTPAARTYLEEWLRDAEGRTVVYIGRDYNAEPDYWRTALPHAPPEQVAEYYRRRAKAMSEWNAERKTMLASTAARWFEVDAKPPPRRAARLEGPWSSGIDPQQTSITLGSRFLPPERVTGPSTYPTLKSEVLLSSDQEVLAMRVTADNWYDSQLIVVTNGSFLLNLPLVKQEHRRLAGKLIEACEADGLNVVFVESDAGGPPIRRRDDDPGPRTGFEMLTVWPMNVVLLHLLFWLLLVCICLYPIFGRPRRLYGALARHARLATSPLASLLLSFRQDDEESEQSSTTGDFGRHLGALGELLSLTRDADFAHDRLQHYHDHVKRDSGASHVPAAKPAPPQNPTNSLL